MKSGGTGERPKRSVWWHCRRVIRWCRISTLLALLVLVTVVIYLGQTGLPGPLKTLVLGELQSHGIAMEYSQLRWRWTGGILAEGVTLRDSSAASRTNTPIQISASEVSISIGLRSLAAGRPRIHSISLKDGHVALPAGETNRIPASLDLERISATLHFLDQDRWELERFEASCLGSRLTLAASITNASKLGSLTGSTGRTQADRDRTPLETRVARWRHWLTQATFTKPPEIHLLVQGDASDPQSVHGRITLHATGVRTQWAEADELTLTSRWGEPKSPGPGRLSDLALTATRLRHTNASASRLVLKADISFASDPTKFTLANYTVQIADLESTWGRTPEVEFTGTSRPSTETTNGWYTQMSLITGPSITPWATAHLKPLLIQGEHTLDWPPQGKLAVAGGARNIKTTVGTNSTTAVTLDWNLNVTHRPPAGARQSPRVPELGFWNALRDLEATGTIDLGDVSHDVVRIDKFSWKGSWKLPLLRFDSLQAVLYGGDLSLGGDLDVVTRRVGAHGKVHFDAHRLDPVIGAAGRKWLSQYTWEEAPLIEGSASLTLPPWTNATYRWKQDLEPGFSLDADLKVGRGGFRGVPILSATSQLVFSNRTWRLPDLHVTRPEGSVTLDYWCDTPTQDYRWGIRSSIDPSCLRPLFGPEADKGFASFQFSSAPHIQGTLWGRWQAPERIGFAGGIAVTNMLLRGEPCGEIRSGLVYTNKTIGFANAELVNGTERASVAAASFDIEGNWVHITNGVTRMDPFRITRIIGPQTTAALAPYKFGTPPEATVEGKIHVKDVSRNDLRFQIAGGPFSYWKFNVPHLAGNLHWVNDSLTVTNLVSKFYEGSMAGNFFFDFSVPDGAQFRFDAAVTNANIHQLLIDLYSPTNKIEGICDGELHVTSANSKDWKSWQGHGSATLRDGFLWAMPLFGMLSPALDAVVPGLGKSKASAGTATFTMKNSVLFTKDLEIYSPAMRLAYDGNVDFDGNINAVVEAQVLRDTGLFGRLFGYALLPLTKLLEYKVTGTLGKPKSELLYIPKFLLLPLQPFRTLKGLFPPSSNTPTPEPERDPNPPNP